MYCDNCGNWVDEHDRFCGVCGAPVADTPRSADSMRNTVHDPMPNPFSEEGRRRAGQAGQVEQERQAAHVESPPQVDPQTQTPYPYGAPQYNTPEPPKKKSPVALLVALAAILVTLIIGVVLVLTGVIHLNVGGENNPLGGGANPVEDDYESIVAALEDAEQLDLRYVSCDVSDYPTVRLYYSARDSSGATVELLDPHIALMEGITGGSQLVREIRSFQMIQGREGVSYELVVDTSSSMDGDMSRVKDILSEFVDALDYDTGDQAELISFDSFVMYMCTYTNSASQLHNGISSMEPYGNTALYDALCEGITNAGSQSGARCVIAFTDGQDNESSHTPEDVVSLANTYDVPVFIIGAAQADFGTLESIANRTGGRYWSITDISDLSVILSDITAGQQGMYCLEYESDASTAATAAREVSFALIDGNRGAVSTSNVEPVEVSEPQKHNSRYELIQADISWTEANEECIRKGGHLVTVTSQDEMNKVCRMAEDAGIDFVWMGGNTSVRGNTAFGHWVTGEPFDFTAWYPGEPSRNDRDGTPEMYIELWRLKSDGEWSWNDERDRPFEDNEMQYMRGRMGYVCEYEDAA